MTYRVPGAYTCLDNHVPDMRSCSPKEDFERELSAQLSFLKGCPITEDLYVRVEGVLQYFIRKYVNMGVDIPPFEKWEVYVTTDNCLHVRVIPKVVKVEIDLNGDGTDAQ